MFRRFTKRRNHSTLQARQSGNLTFNRRAWPKGLCPPLSRHLVRSGGLSLTYAQPAALPLLAQGAACSLWCLFAVRSLPATFLLLVQRGQVTLRQKVKLRWNSSRLAVLRG